MGGWALARVWALARDNTVYTPAHDQIPTPHCTIASLPDLHYYHNIYAVMHHAEIYTTFLFTAPNRHFM